jgi:hypothetical protein
MDRRCLTPSARIGVMKSKVLITLGQLGACVSILVLAWMFLVLILSLNP